MALSSGVLNIISSKLDVSNIKEGSFLYSILNIVDDYANAKIIDVNKKLNNIHIETCDNDSLIRYGNDLGIEKMSIPLISVMSSDNLVYIETPNGETFPSFLNGKILLKKGQTIYYRKVTITILEDVIVDSLLSKIYINCTIQSSDNYTYTSNTINPITVGDQYLKYVNLKVESDIVFSFVEESYLSYRMRILNEINISKNNTPKNIEKYIVGIPGIKIVDIYNNELFFCTDEMFEEGTSVKTGQYKKIIQSELSRLLPWPINYTVIAKDRTDIKIEISIIGTQINDSSNIIATVYDFIYRSISGNQKILPIKETEEYIFSRLKEVITISYKIYDTVTDATMLYLPESFNDCYLFLDISNIKVV